MWQVFDISLIAINFGQLQCIFRIMSTSGSIMDQICPPFLHVFSVNLDVILP